MLVSKNAYSGYRPNGSHGTRFVGLQDNEQRLVCVDMSDVDSIDNLIHALYEIISAPAGVARNWDRDRNLFFPGARLIRTSVDKNGKPKARSMEFETYKLSVDQLLKNQGFHEKEIARKTNQFGNFAHVLSSYEARHNLDDKVAFKRGLNSIQLYFDGKRWWIVNMIWDNERPGLRLPPDLEK